MLRLQFGNKRAEGWSNPKHHFGHGTVSQECGRYSPTRGFARGQIDRGAMRNLLFLGHLLDHQGDGEGDAIGDLRLSCTRHLLALQ